MAIDIVPPSKDWRVVISKTLRVGTDLDAEFRRHAELMGQATYYAAAAKREVRKLKDELRLKSAKLRRRIRIREGHKTKDEMEYAVELKRSYREIADKLQEAQYHEDVINGLVKALDHKRDCLVQISANSRKELPEELRALAESMRRKINR